MPASSSNASLSVCVIATSQSNSETQIETTPVHPAGGGLGQHHERSTDRVVALSGIPTNPCTLPWGDHFVSLATQNKQDWCRLHGYEFHVMASSCDLRIRPGPWQKIAMMRQVGPVCMQVCACACFCVCWCVQLWSC